MNMAERFRTARKIRKISQADLGELIGVSRGVITNIEYGKAEPQPIVSKAIATVLHVNEEWLLTGEGEMLETEDEERTRQYVEMFSDFIDGMAEEEQNYIMSMLKQYSIFRLKMKQKNKLQHPKSPH